MARGLYVAGTDTGVGKTLVACGLIRLLREDGVDAVGFKAVVTGRENGTWSDAEALHEASGRVEPLETLCPIRLRAPLAPVPSAREEGAEVDLDIARKHWRVVNERHDAVVVEGIGGLMVPLDESILQIEFITELMLPVLLVARAGLGTINHTLLSVQELHRADIPVVGIVLSVTCQDDADNVRHSLPEIERFSFGLRPIVVPHFPGDGALMDKVDRAALALREGLDVAGVMG